MRNGCRALLVTLAALVLVMGPPPAWAQEKIAIEFYEGERPPHADRLVGAVLDEVHRHGYAIGAVVRRAYEERGSRPGMGELTAVELRDVAELAEMGFVPLKGARFEDAELVFTQAVWIAEQAPADFSSTTCATRTGERWSVWRLLTRAWDASVRRPRA